jgi:hypothetical protein
MQRRQPIMKLYPLNAAVTRSLSRRASVACAAAFLVLGGCAAYEAGSPKSAVNYQEPPAAKTENQDRSLEQVITDQREWYQMIN